MSTKKRTAWIMRIIAAALILISVVMLFLPWMKLVVTVGGETYSVNGLLEQTAQMEGTTSAQMKAELVNELQNWLQEKGDDLNVRFDTTKLVSLVNTALKGAWSPFSLTRMLGNVKSLLSPVMAALNVLSSFLGGSEFASLSKSYSTINVSHIVLLILLIVTLAAAALAILCALIDRKWGMLPYVILVLILLVMFFILMAAFNGNSADIMRLIDVEPEQGGIGLRIGAGAILCLVLAVLGFVAMFLPIGRKAAEAGDAPAVRAAAAPRPAAGWTCPACGAKLKKEQKFCPHCGTKRPEQPAPEPAPAPAAAGWTCPGCGAALRADQKFCPGCGSRRPEQPAPESAPAPAPSGWTCPACGAELRTEQKFCPNCGTRKPEPEREPVPEFEPVPETEPECEPVSSGWICPGCGAILNSEQKFCNMCGTRRPEPKFEPEPEPEEEYEPTITGIPAKRICRACGTQLIEGMSFCPKCGTREERR